ncbi:2-phospho-L-lactate guanylyltransferase [Nocardioides sp. MAHUQ-72]|uniref:2-phospho-L-lactate guanylyltransferase n=1 Tax=unclassified Nocardioides TaxID=2615069 RepID=UPI0036187BF2
MTSPQYVVLVPVKPPAHGKSRLAGASDERRRELAAAFALDTVSACLAADRVHAVLAVTDDAPFAARLAALGCSSIPDGVTGDLNATLGQAAAEVDRRWPGLVPVAVCADLPALRPEELDDVLGRVPADTAAFVADQEGVGTTLYAAPYALFAPRFGPGSRFAHLGTGALEIEGALPTLRRDVDDLDDLRGALALGVGRHTAAVTASAPEMQ